MIYDYRFNESYALPMIFEMLQAIQGRKTAEISFDGSITLRP